jgi:hypothetical protein
MQIHGLHTGEIITLVTIGPSHLRLSILSDPRFHLFPPGAGDAGEQRQGDAGEEPGAADDVDAAAPSARCSQLANLK